jgi:hypothetical protein
MAILHTKPAAGRYFAELEESCLFDQAQGRIVEMRRGVTNILIPATRSWRAGNAILI